MNWIKAASKNSVIILFFRYLGSGLSITKISPTAFGVVIDEVGIVRNRGL